MREKEAGLRNEAVGEERAELPEQAVAVVRVDDERQQIAQVEAVNAEQGLRVDRVAAGNQIDLIRAGSEKIDEFFDLIGLLQTNFYFSHIQNSFPSEQRGGGDTAADFFHGGHGGDSAALCGVQTAGGVAEADDFAERILGERAQLLGGLAFQ